MHVLALAGGVGGSKLAYGLYRQLGPRLTVIVNTGDDETMFGLRVCPDLDTLRYTLSGMANPETGWGIREDTFHALAQLEAYGMDTWFKLGDRDLATDLARTQLLSEGVSLTEVERRLDGSAGLSCRILPMCNEPVATRIRTATGELSFQDYFVKQRHEPAVESVAYRGIERASVTAECLDAIASADTIVLCPSNPMVSIQPILSVPGLRQAIATSRAAKIAVSPIVAGQAVSGPAGQMMAAAGYDVSAFGLARLYGDFLSGIVIDWADKELELPLRRLGLEVLVTKTILSTAEDKVELAGRLLEWAADQALTVVGEQ